jgi:hypothetical protein
MLGRFSRVTFLILKNQVIYFYFCRSFDRQPIVREHAYRLYLLIFEEFLRFSALINYLIKLQVLLPTQ